MPDTLHARLRAVYEERLAVARAATEGPWWSDESDDAWRLHGVAFMVPAQGAIREQVVNKQILKAPKRGTPYAEYWPDPADAAFILANDPAATILRCEALLRVVERHRPVKARGGPVGWESDRIACDACAPTRWPCPDIRDLAAGEGIEL